MDTKNLLAKRAKVMMYSALSEILRVAGKPAVLSLAGGLPAVESFPLEMIDKLSHKVITKYEGAAFQYGPTNGAEPLRKAISIWIKERHMKVGPENVGITSGSQGGLDCLGKVFINRGDILAVESPTYIGAVDAFAPYGPKYAEIETDEQGAISASLEKILKTKKIKFIYLVPTFQNPTGKTIPGGRRKEIAKIIKKYNALLVEDDPYNSLRYKGKAIDPIQTLIPENTIYLSTFSKVLSPGLRIGFYVAPLDIARLMVAAKQSVDLCTSSFGQYVAAEYLATGDLKKHLPNILKIYKSRMGTMLKSLEKYFPKSFSWTHPEGGMFIWVEGPKNFNATKLYWKAIENNIAYVPGIYFYVKQGEGKNTMRLNFTNVDEDKIDMAIKKLSEVIGNNS
jgi:2-aminoadipate transaminase